MKERIRLKSVELERLEAILKKSKSPYFSFIFFTLIVVGLILIYNLFFANSGLKLNVTNAQDLSAFLKSYGHYAILLGILAILLQTFFPFAPFILIAGANVLVFGFFTGFIINYITACVAALLVFLFARYYGHDWVKKKMDKYPKLTKWNNQLETHGFFYVFIGRLILIFPSSVINLGAGVSKMRARDFILGTVLGKLPIVFLESLIAHDLQDYRHNLVRLLFMLTIFIGLIGLGLWIRRKNLRGT